MSVVRKYSFNNNTGNTTHDDSENHIDAELSGTAQFTPNGAGLALLNYPCIMPDTGFPTGVSVRYCSFWFKSTNMAERRLFLYGSNWGNMFEGWYQANCVGVNSTGYAWFSTWHDTGIYSTTYPVCDGAWHFIEYKNNSEHSYSLYINTVYVGSFFSGMNTILNGTAQIGFADGDEFDEFVMMSTIPTDVERDIIFTLGNTGGLPPVANFTYVIESNKVTFTDISIGSVVNANWSFGDNATSSIQNPVHTYATAGEYLVTLFSERLIGGNSYNGQITKTIVITVAPVVYYTDNKGFKKDWVKVEKNVNGDLVFEYQVLYTHSQGLAPASNYPKVRILCKGEEVAIKVMTKDDADIDYRNGVIYTATYEVLISDSLLDDRYYAEYYTHVFECYSAQMTAYLGIHEKSITQKIVASNAMVIPVEGKTYSLGLINTKDELNIFDSVMDINITNVGRVSKVTGYNKLSQQLKKFILSSFRDSKYGTNIKDYIGTSNNVKQELEMVVKEGLNNFKALQRNSLQSLHDNEILNEIISVEVQKEATNALITCKIKTKNASELRILEISL